jgi:hypothetical protein
MKSMRIILLVVILAGSMSFVAGCGGNIGTVSTGGDFVRFVEIYITQDNNFVLPGGCAPTRDILLFKGDRFIFYNLADKAVRLELPKDMFNPHEKMIEPDVIMVEPKKRFILEVSGVVTEMGLIQGTKVDEIIHGSPNLKVGEEP